MKFSLFMLPCFRAGVAPSLHCFYEELIEVVKLCDASGWDRVWQSEHHFHYYGGAVPNPAVILTAWARETRRIRLGPAISLLPLRNPLHVAEDFAMLDQLSGGRMDFGIGRGYLPHEFDAHNVDGDAASEIRSEAFEIITRAWAGETFAYDGKHFAFPRLKLHPTPLQEMVPIWVAASRTRDSFEWAGQNGYNLMMNQYPVSPAQSREYFGWYRDAWEAAGHDPGKREAMMNLFLYVADTEEQAIAESKATVREHANLFRLLFQGDRWNEDYAGDDSVFDFLAPDGDIEKMFRERTLVGTPEQLIERVAGYRDAGFTELSFMVRTGDWTHQQALRTVERFNAEVMPAFR